MAAKEPDPKYKDKVKDPMHKAEQGPTDPYWFDNLGEPHDWVSHVRPSGPPNQPNP